ncbi:hypothetical protein THAOC_08274, partial [Thalassiosira oceanica]
ASCMWMQTALPERKCVPGTLSTAHKHFYIHFI